jgi:hypothetical protein
MSVTNLCERLQEFHAAVTEVVSFATIFAITRDPRAILAAYEAEEKAQEKLNALFASIMGREPTEAEVNTILHLGD